MNVAETENINSNLSNGNRLFVSGKTELAIKEYMAALSKNPDFYVYHENIGWCYERLNDHFNAKKFYKKALELNPNAIRAKFFVDGNLTIENGTIKNKPLFFPQIHEAAAAVDKQSLKDEYFEKKLHLKKDDFALIRIIGNDLYPRHKIGQSRENVAFILENEPTLEHCRKVWVVNRIFDKEELSKILSLLDTHKQEYYVIPFIEAEYKTIGLDYTCLPSPDFLHSEDFEKLSIGVKQRALVSMLRLKNNYVMNNNGARNYALNLGKTLAKWALPWDGNCFMNKASWDAMVKGVLDEPYLKHFVVPMARITSNKLMLDNEHVPDASEEPQIIFRHDSQEKFNENFSYGRRPKVELFWRLGIPGAWDTYKDDQWDLPRLPTSLEAHQFGIAGWTARLFSGMAEQETQNSKGSANRNSARQLAICLAIQNIDKRINIHTKSNKFYELMENSYNCSPSKNLEEKYKGKTIVYVHRRDGLGERLKAITNGVALAKILSAEFKFYWEPKKGEDASFHAINNVHKIFSADFINNHYATPEEIEWFEKKSIYTTSVNEANTRKNTILKVEQGFDFSEVKDFDYGFYFSQIGFSENILRVIDAAEKFTASRSFNAIHIRGGDIIYGKYRFFERFQRKAMPVPLASILASNFLANGREVIVFAQDKAVKSVFDKKLFEIIDETHYQDDWENLEIAFFEIMLMSKAGIIVSGSSGFSDLAAKIGGNKVKSYLDFFEKTECSKLITKFIDEHGQKLDLLQKAYSYYMGYNISKDQMTLEEKCSFLKNAYDLDQGNNLYPVRIVLECLISNDHSKAESYSFAIFEKIKTKDEFTSLIFALESALNMSPESKLIFEKIPDSEDYPNLKMFKALNYLAENKNTDNVDITTELNKKTTNLDIKNLLYKVSILSNLEKRA